VFHRRPDLLEVNPELVMYEHVAHADDGGPRDVRTTRAKLARDAAARFPENFQVVHHPHLQEWVGIERRSTAPCLIEASTDCLDRVP
jgi:hypothetical protein